MAISYEAPEEGGPMGEVHSDGIWIDTKNPWEGTGYNTT